MNDAAMIAAVSAFKNNNAELHEAIVTVSWMLAFMAVLIVAIAFLDDTSRDCRILSLSLGGFLAVAAAAGLIGNFGINLDIADPQPTEASAVEKVEPKACLSGSYDYEAWIFDSSTYSPKRMTFGTEPGTLNRYVVVDGDSVGCGDDGKPTEAIEISFDEGCRYRVLVMTEDLAHELAKNSINGRSE